MGEDWEVRVLAFVSVWGECWSIVRMGEPFCRLGRWEVSLEVDRLGFWVNERRRELRRGERGWGLVEGVLVAKEGSDCRVD